MDICSQRVLATMAARTRCFRGANAKTDGSRARRSVGCRARRRRSDRPPAPTWSTLPTWVPRATANPIERKAMRAVQRMLETHRSTGSHVPGLALYHGARSRKPTEGRARARAGASPSSDLFAAMANAHAIETQYSSATTRRPSPCEASRGSVCRETHANRAHAERVLCVPAALNESDRSSTLNPLQRRRPARDPSDAASSSRQRAPVCPAGLCYVLLGTTARPWVSHQCDGPRPPGSCCVRRRANGGTTVTDRSAGTFADSSGLYRTNTALPARLRRVRPSVSACHLALTAIIV